jgi:hypothetical protein
MTEKIQAPSSFPSPLCNHKKNKSRRRLLVRFRSSQSREQVRPISRISEYDLAEVLAVWGNDDEHELRLQELQQTISEYAASPPNKNKKTQQQQQQQQRRRDSDNVTFTAVGLIEHVPGHRRHDLKLQVREAAWQAVLWEQYYQQEQQQEKQETEQQQQQQQQQPNNTRRDNEHHHEDENDMELDQVLLAKVYHKAAARKAQELAYQEARRLEQELLTLYKEEN